MSWPYRLEDGSNLYFAALNWRKQVGFEDSGFDVQHIYVTVAKDEAGRKEDKGHRVVSGWKR
jgi:hypothetical protein